MKNKLKQRSRKRRSAARQGKKPGYLSRPASFMLASSKNRYSYERGTDIHS